MKYRRAYDGPSKSGLGTGDGIGDNIKYSPFYIDEDKHDILYKYMLSDVRTVKEHLGDFYKCVGGYYGYRYLIYSVPSGISKKKIGKKRLDYGLFVKWDGEEILTIRAQAKERRAIISWD